MEYSIAKIRDKIRLSEKTGKIISTNFLTPVEISEALVLLKNYEYYVTGGFEEAERRIIIIGSFANMITDFCTVIRVEAFNDILLTHRSVLGSVLALGIKREMIGDLIVNGRFCDIIIMCEMKEYILNNLTKIGRESVSIKEVRFDELLRNDGSKKEKHITVSSLRVDAIISSGFEISREKSAGLIKIEKVLINFLPCKNISKSISKGDLISVRGFGRIRVLEILGENKKGRIRMLVEIF